MQIVNFIFHITTVLVIMYLFSSGREYMKYAAVNSDRPFWLDVVLMGVLAGFSFYLAFHPSKSITSTYILNLPLWVHLIHLAYLSHKFKHKK